MRAVGVDLGTKRIGIALSDSGGVLATPYEVVQRSGSQEADHKAIAGIVDETEAEIVVVGLPLSLDGSPGPAAEQAAAEVEALAGRLSVPVEVYDERLTTVSADRALMAAEMDARSRRRVVDKVAAAVMLQAWLDARRSR